MTHTTCSIDGCNKGGRIIKEMCMMHYERVRRYGSPAEPHLARASDRFWSKVDKTDSCWLWTGIINAAGYGRFSVGTEEKWLAHRYAWTKLVGDIPSGLHIDHMCHVHNCVNPAHLRPATNKENHENLKGASSRSKTGILGVSWDSSKRKWRAAIGHHGKQVHVGRFDTIEEAGAAVVAKRNELFTHNLLDRAA